MPPIHVVLCYNVWEEGVDVIVPVCIYNIAHPAAIDNKMRD